MTSRATILVSGMVSGDPWQGGATWAVMQYVLGLARLGHEVYLVEPITFRALRDSSGDFFEGQPLPGLLERSANAAYFQSVAAHFQLGQRASLLMPETGEAVGLSYKKLRAVARRADLLINIAGMLTDEALLSSIPARVYLDLDPAFCQLWEAAQGIDMRFGGHTHFVTVGQGLGEPQCSIPTCGRPWLKTLPPVVLEYWPKARLIAHNALTTIANWRAYGSIEHLGVFYGQKVHSLRSLITLPTHTPAKFLLALSIHPKETNDLEALRANRWGLIDPLVAAGTPAKYRQFIRSSRAEFGIAKSGYVVSNCGWFSDRSACYLASGRPVIAQDTGFSRYLPTGEGLFSFRTSEDALNALEELNRDYVRQAKKAREMAEAYFASDLVLQRLLNQLAV